MRKKKKKLQRVAGQWSPAILPVQDGTQSAAADNHEDEGIPLPRPVSSPCSGAMGTMESSIDADEVVAALVNGDNGVPLALENGVGSASSLSTSEDPSFHWSGLSLASSVVDQEGACESHSPRSGEGVLDLDAEGNLSAGESQRGVLAEAHAELDSGALVVDKVNHSENRTVNSGEGAPDLQPGEEAPDILATTNSVQDEYCMVCNSTHWKKTGDNLLLCDTPNCLRGCHLSCLGLTRAPRGDWFCDQCSVKRELSLNIPLEFQGPPVLPGTFLDRWAKNGALQFIHHKRLESTAGGGIF